MSPLVVALLTIVAVIGGACLIGWLSACAGAGRWLSWREWW